MKVTELKTKNQKKSSDIDMNGKMKLIDQNGREVPFAITSWETWSDVPSSYWFENNMGMDTSYYQTKIKVEGILLNEN